MLSAEQITALGDKALSYNMVDMDGNPTGEFTPQCGVDITGLNLTEGAVAAGTPMGLFVVANAPNMDTCEKLMEAVVSKGL